MSKKTLIETVFVLPIHAVALEGGLWGLRDNNGKCLVGAELSGHQAQQIANAVNSHDRLVEQLEEYKSNTNKTVCAYCGYKGEKDAEDFISHMSSCGKRPEIMLINKALELEGKLESVTAQRDQITPSGIDIKIGDIVKATGEEYYDNASFTSDGSWEFVGELIFDQDSASWLLLAEDHTWFPLCDLWHHPVKHEVIKALTLIEQGGGK